MLAVELLISENTLCVCADEEYRNVSPHQNQQPSDQSNEVAVKIDLVLQLMKKKVKFMN